MHKIFSTVLDTQKALQKMLAIIFIVTLMITSILSHKLPEVDMVIVTDSIDWLVQHPL